MTVGQYNDAMLTAVAQSECLLPGAGPCEVKSKAETSLSEQSSDRK